MSWSEKLKGVIGAVKDTGATAAIRRWLARELADYGEVVDFTFNSRERLVQMDFMLKGEREKLTIRVTDYELLRRPDGDYIAIRKAEASREWVDAVLRNLVIGKPHRIPEQYSSMARMVLGV